MSLISELLPIIPRLRRWIRGYQWKASSDTERMMRRQQDWIRTHKTCTRCADGLMMYNVRTQVTRCADCGDREP